MQTHHQHQQRRRRLSVGAATAVAVAAAASAANGAGVEGFHVAVPLAAAGSTGGRQAHVHGCRHGCDASDGWRLLHHRQRVGGSVDASGGLGPGKDSGLCFCLGGGRAAAATRRLGRTTMCHSRIGDGSSRTSGIWGRAGGGWPARDLGPTATQQQQQQQRCCRGRGSDDRSLPPSALAMMRAGASGGGGAGGGDRHSFKKKGDIPSLVVGAGILVARHRSSIRAGNERRNVVIKTGDAGRISRDEGEAAAVAKVGGGVGATVTAASAGLRMGLGEVSASRRFAAASGSSGGGGERRTTGGGRQRQRSKTPGSGPSALASTRGRGAGGGEWDETVEWQEDDGTQEAEMDGAEEWTEVEEATDERQQQQQQQQRRSTEAESSPNAVLPLELGQELTLCGLDSNNQVVHGNYMPLTPRKQRGYFDIVMKRDKGEIDDGLKSTRSAREFSHFLDHLPLGDEIAVKPGREGLVYGGPDQPITDLVLIATGVGVVPMIQMVNELLPSSSSSVASASVIWLNEKTEDFALYGELEKAFFLNHRKLDVSCIVERDLFGNHLEANPNVCEATPGFKVGTLAAVAGPEFFTRKVTDYLMRRGYPEESIIKL
eukprot:g7616.t1